MMVVVVVSDGDDNRQSNCKTVSSTFLCCISKTPFPPKITLLLHAALCSDHGSPNSAESAQMV